MTDDIPVAATVVILRDGSDGLEVLMIRRPDRGSFAGAWVFPGGKIEPADVLTEAAAEEDVARRAAARETLEETGLRVDADGLTTLSLWVPPVEVAVRIRTWFFATAEAEGHLTPSPDEVEEARWVRPADMLARHGRAEVTLYPPTWVTLHGMTVAADAAGLVGAARLAGLDRFETVTRATSQGEMFVWQGDVEHGTAASDRDRHRLETAELPWRYTRTS